MTNNKFVFALKDSTKEYTIGFSWNGEYSIDNVNDFSTVKASQSGNELTIDIEANRHKSKQTAVWYKKSVDKNTSKMIHTKKGSADPTELNFAIKGTLTINQEEFQICLGQGSYGGSVNNWHLCSTAIEADNDHKAGYLGKKYYLSQSGSNTFDVQLVSDMSNCYDNEFELTMKDHEIEDLSFELTDHCISQHQPFAGVTCSCTDGNGVITIKAGRHKSAAVADWFKKEVNTQTKRDELTGKFINTVVEQYVLSNTGIDLNMNKLGTSAIGCSTVSSLPDSLNFAVKGRLNFTVAGNSYTVEDFLLSQGSYAKLRNNWWLGSPKMHGASVPTFGGVLCSKTTSQNQSSQWVIWSSLLNLSVNSMSMQFLSSAKADETIGHQEVTESII